MVQHPTGTPATTPAPWSRDELTGLVQGKLVRLIGPTIEEVPLPDWLLAPSAGRCPYGPLETLERSDPKLHAGLMAWFYSSNDLPGELLSFTNRMRYNGVWHRVTIELVNLIHEPGIEGIVAAYAIHEPVEVDESTLPGRFVGESDSARWVHARLDATAQILHIEGKVAEVFGRRSDEMIGTRATDYQHDDSVADSTALWLSMIAEGPGATRSSRRYLLRPDGTHVWVETAYLNRLRENGEGDVLMFAYDITERREQAEALQRREEEFRLLADEVPSAVFRCDARGRVTFHNARWSLLVAEDDTTCLQDVAHPGVLDQVNVLLARVAACTDGTPYRMELPAAAPGRTYDFRMRSVGGGDADIIGSITDVTDTVRLRAQAQHDPLTGLLNRAGLEAALTRMLGEDGSRGVVVFIDLNDFKPVNDRYGHEAGDLVLAEVGRRLRHAVRPEDAVGRLGGDEFVIVSRASGTDVAVTMDRRITAALAPDITWNGGHWQPSASVGIVQTDDADEALDVLRRADAAMYEAKRQLKAAR